MLDSGKHLKEYIDLMIDEKISNLPLSFPCEVVSQSENKVKVKTLLPVTPLDSEREIPIMESPYLSFPINKGDIGLAMTCSFLFEKATQDEPINEKIPTIRENGLVFIPLVPKSKWKGEEGKTIIYDQTQENYISITKEGVIEAKNKNANLTISDQGAIEIKNQNAGASISDNGAIEIKNSTAGATLSDSGEVQLKNTTASVTIDSAGLIEIKGASATAGKILNDVATLLSTMVKTPLAGNGAPMSGGNPKLELDIATLITNIKGNLK